MLDYGWKLWHLARLKPVKLGVTSGQNKGESRVFQFIDVPSKLRRNDRRSLY